ncbi:hypothetical protein BKA70DRAFT_1090499 [Coprinopsis sp. MPI-PUGE-AT-0042]|nr:hypothetical protein BKA70DRAFT_1090499 [Coprinopsis sp. MPI-PUGE-AT-0042]
MPARIKKPTKQRETVSDVFASPEVFDAIYSCLEPGNSIRLSRACKAAAGAFDEFSVRAHNIDKFLLRYFSDPTGFRKLQARTATLISGSAAVQFMDRTFYPESDMDLYTPPCHVLEVGEWILSEGYTYKPTERRPDFHEAAKGPFPDDYEPETDYPASGIAALFEFQKGEGQVVQLIAAKHSPFHSIMTFHSTCVMNFITYEAAYSLYPGPTFDHRITLTSREAGESQLRGIAKYTRRGWTATDNAYYLPNKYRDAFLLDVPRWVKDSHTWRIPLKALDVPPRRTTPTSLPLEGDPAVANSWRLTSKSTGKTPVAINSTTGNFFVSECLQYRYMFADKQLQWTVTHFLFRQLKYETKKFREAIDAGSSAEEADDSWS